MFAWWGRALVRVRWWVLGVTLAFVAVGAVWGSGIFGALSGGGFDDPSSESTRAHSRIADVFGPLGDDVVVLYTAPRAFADEPGLADPVQGVIHRLTGRPEVVQIVSAYGEHADPSHVSRDQHSTYLSIRLRPGNENAKLADLAAIEPLVQAGGTVQTVVGGNFAFLRDANHQIEADIVRAEVLSLPILLVLLLFIFRGVVAALTPLLVGGVAILGGFTVTRVIASLTEVSVFAANVITLLGLGMAIDYALFVVSRFREELGSGRSTAEAVRTTIRTAGRTVVVSGLTVTLALSSLLIFPMDFLKSVAYGGMAAVVVAMIATLTALPALLAVLGPRINAGRVALRGRRPGTDRTDGMAATRPTSAARTDPSRADGPPPPPYGERPAPAERGAWARLAHSVMRRPWIYAVVVAAILFGLASPFARADFGGFDERVLPDGTASRTVAEILKADFPGGGIAPIVVLVEGADQAQLIAYTDAIHALPGVTAVGVAASRDNVNLVNVGYVGEATAGSTRDLVKAIRNLPDPEGGTALVGGRSAADLDQIHGLSSRLPWMGLYVFAVTFVLLFLAFGSVVLPVKAIVMNIVSVGASFGVVVWVFQDGHLSGFLGFTPTGFLEPTNLVLMLAILFGLSTDYEIFLLSRIREEYLKTGDNRAAVAAGLQRTGGIITAAAVLLIIVIAGFITGGTATMKLLGVGTVVAVAVDAALVRTLLVPATMRLLGRWNWWAPPSFVRLHTRLGFHEGEPPMPAAATPTPAAPPAPLTPPKIQLRGEDPADPRGSDRSGV